MLVSWPVTKSATGPEVLAVNKTLDPTAVEML
jgi:hypothetical protein